MVVRHSLVNVGNTEYIIYIFNIAVKRLKYLIVINRINVS